MKSRKPITLLRFIFASVSPESAGMLLKPRIIAIRPIGMFMRKIYLQSKVTSSPPSTGPTSAPIDQAIEFIPMAFPCSLAGKALSSIGMPTVPIMPPPIPSTALKMTAVIFRAVEGIGGGIMGTEGIPILLSAFPASEHGKAIGINSIAWSIGALVGPVLGGLLVTFDWRYIFLINIPIGLIAIILGLSNIPADSGDTLAKINLSNVIGFLLFIVPLTA